MSSRLARSLDTAFELETMLWSLNPGRQSSNDDLTTCRTLLTAEFEHDTTDRARRSVRMLFGLRPHLPRHLYRSADVQKSEALRPVSAVAAQLFSDTTHDTLGPVYGDRIYELPDGERLRVNIGKMLIQGSAGGRSFVIGARNVPDWQGEQHLFDADVRRQRGQMVTEGLALRIQVSTTSDVEALLPVRLMPQHRVDSVAIAMAHTLALTRESIDNRGDSL